MNARIFARGTRLIIRRGQVCRRQCYRPHPERGFCNGFRPLITRSISAPPVIANSEASLFTAALLSAVNKDRCGSRNNRLRPSVATTSATSLACCGFATAPLPAVTNYLSKLSDTSACFFRAVIAGALRVALQSPLRHTVSHVLPPT